MEASGSRTLIEAARSRVPVLAGAGQLGRAAVVAGYLLAYLALDWATFFDEIEPIGITPWNPAPGISLALILIGGVAYAPAIMAASLLGDLLVRGWPGPWPASLLAALIIGIGYGALGWFLRRFVRLGIGLGQVRDIVWLSGATLPFVAVIGAGYVTLYAVAGRIAWDQHAEAWFQFWVADVLGVVVFTPFLLVVARPWLHASTRPLLPRGLGMRYALELLAQTVAVLMALAVLGAADEASSFKRFYPLFLPLIWIAVRHGQAGAVWAVLAIQLGLFAIVHSHDYPLADVRAWQLVTFAIAMTGLLLGTVVSQQRRAEAALRQSEARMQAIVGTAPDAIVIVDAAGRVAALNPAAERLFGAGVALLDRRAVADLLPGWTGTQRELRARDLEGNEIPVEVTTSRFYDQAHAFTTLILRDISERRQAEDAQRLLQSQLAHVSRVALSGAMTSALAHELNQPLAAILNYARACQRLLSGARTVPPEVPDAVADIASETERASGIIRSLRSLLRKGEIERAAQRLDPLIGEAVALAQPDASRAGIQLQVVVPADLPPVHADRVHVQQVLLNLIRNSIEALIAGAARERHIRIEARHREPGFVEISVADTGPGVDVAVRDRLFHPFATTKRDGMGLGLSISYSIVEAHEGRLRLVSGAGGACFAFTLPVAVTESQ